MCLALVVMAALWGCEPSGSGKSGGNEVAVEKVSIKLARETVKGEYRLVDTQELKQWLDQGKEMLVVDAMPYDASYKKQHIPGAAQFLFPIKEMAAWDPEQTGGKSQEDFLALLGPDKERTLVFYCGFVKCGRSHNAAAWAVRNGYTDVYRHPGGIKAWTESGYPVEKGK